jgi:bifunctional pyridoxal-dependent enzyme with beta-cystathionase and maltose regulon repressor activities
MLSRTNYTDREEQEAEAIAGWLSSRFQPTDSPPGVIIPAGVDPRIRTLLDALSPEED